MKKRTISFIASILLVENLSSDGIGNFFDSQISTSYSGGGSFKGQTRGVYTVGGFKTRYSNLGSFSPVHITLPSLKMGCGGIDGTFGSFSYLNPEYIIEKGKAIIASAPAFAFQLSLSTLDKDTQSIVQELEKTVNQINSFNIDSCKASQQLGNTASEKFFEKILNKNIHDGWGEFGIAERTKSSLEMLNGRIASAQSFFNGNAEKAKAELEKTVMVGSLLSDSLEKTSATGLGLNIFGASYSGSHSILEGFLRYTVGDLIGYKKGNTNEFTYETSIVGAGADMSLKEFLNGGEVKVFFATLGNDNLGKPFIEETTIHTSGAIKIFNEKIKSILTSMRTNTQISTADRAFIQSLPIPIYRFLNSQALSGNTDDKLLSEYLALIETKAMMDWILIGSINGMRMTVKDDPTGANEQRARIMDNARLAKNQVNAEFDILMKDFKAKRALIDYYKTIEVEMSHESSY